MLYRGIFHVHSKHSYDGKESLRDVCAELRRRKFDFLLLTEHDDTLEPSSYARIISECHELSDRRFLVVPGLEIRCWRSESVQWHIAAVGVQSWIARGPISDVIQNIHKAGGLAVFLHPFQYAREIDIQELFAFDGLELWNGKNDGNFAPRWRTLRLANRLSKNSNRPSFFCGHDLHGLSEFAPFALEVTADSLSVEPLLDSLRNGRFLCRARSSHFPSSSGPTILQIAVLGFRRILYSAYTRVRRVPILGDGLHALRKAARRDR
jgi:hypothetical protein